MIDVTTPESLQTLAECADVAIDVRTVDFDGEAELLAGKVRLSDANAASSGGPLLTWPKRTRGSHPRDTMARWAAHEGI